MVAPALASSTVTLEPGSFVETASYVIWTDGTTIYAKNGQTGEIEFSGTDATTVIQNAINNGYSVFLKNGNYTITTYLQISKSNFVLRGESWQARIIPQGDNTAIMIKSGCSGVIIENLMIDGSNQATATDTPPNEGEEYKLGIYFASSGGIVSKCYIYNTGSDSIYGAGSLDVLVINNYIKKTRGWYASIHAHGNNHNFVVIGNIIEDSHVGAIRHGSIILGNKIINCGKNYKDAIIYTGGGATPNDLSIVANNYLYNVTGIGIMVYYGYNIISDNILYSASGNIKPGILFDQYENTYYNIVKDNIIKNFRHGMELSSYTRFTRVVGNLILDPEYDGIVVNQADIITISNNIINNTGHYGINIISGTTLTYSIIEGNHFLNIGYSAIIKNVDLIDTTTSIIKNNVGYVTENSGSVEFSGTSVSFAHGLAGTPTGVWASFNSTGYGGWTWTANSTHITITVANTGDYTVYWRAEYKP